jgi:hypothetical protein
MCRSCCTALVQVATVLLRDLPDLGKAQFRSAGLAARCTMERREDAIAVVFVDASAIIAGRDIACALRDNRQSVAPTD